MSDDACSDTCSDVSVLSWLVIAEQSVAQASLVDAFHEIEIVRLKRALDVARALAGLSNSGQPIRAAKLLQRAARTTVRVKSATHLQSAARAKAARLEALKRKSTECYTTGLHWNLTAAQTYMRFAFQIVTQWNRMCCDPVAS